MIEEVDLGLKEWVNGLMPGIPVSLSPPRAADVEAGVGLYLMELLPSAPASNFRRPPLQLLLRYLVTCWAEDPQQAHKMLGGLVFAAMEHPGYDVDLELLPPEIWRAFGVAPRPCFRLRVPLRLERSEPTDIQVRSPIEVHRTPLAPMRGQVLGPGDIPVADARVELSTHTLATHSDAKGRFGFAAVPTKPPVKRFRIQARGRELTTELEFKGKEAESLVIHFDTLEV